MSDKTVADLMISTSVWYSGVMCIVFSAENSLMFEESND